MPNTISKIKLPGSNTVYDIKDSSLTSRVSSLETVVSSSLLFKGTVSAATDITGLTNYKTGWCYRATAAFTITNVGTIEVGDMIICISDYNSAYNASDWTIVQNNIEGAVTGPSSATSGHIPTFNGTTGKIIQDGYGVATTVGGSSTAIPTDNAVKTYVDTSFTNYVPFYIGATAPSNTNLLWIDINNGLKYYNGSAWTTVPVAYYN